MSTATKTNQTAIYKGRKYRLLWAGPTKYGRRAKLGFFDGSKEFWVDESAVQLESSGSGSSHRRSLTNGDVYVGRNGEEKVFGCMQCSRLGHMCPSCHHDEYDC